MLLKWQKKIVVTLCFSTVVRDKSMLVKTSHNRQEEEHASLNFLIGITQWIAKRKGESRLLSVKLGQVREMKICLSFFGSCLYFCYNEYQFRFGNLGSKLLLFFIFFLPRSVSRL